MNYLSVEGLTKSFGDRTILNNISFGIQQGQKVALVGINGSGKSTLLKALTNQISPDSGEIVFKNDILVKHLLQNPRFSEAEKIMDAVFDSGNPDHQLLRDYEKAVLRSSLGHENHKELESLIERIDAKNLWDLESQAKQILGKLGLHDLEKEISQLSGGQQKRIALAQVLIQKPDLLIMDEPTNHLDIETIEWLESYLSSANMALILVTHDRYFLEKVTNEIIELEFGELYQYKGDYSYFLEKKAERKESQTSTIDKAQNLYKRELEWMRRQPKARGTKAKYRIDAFHETKKVAKSGSREQSLDLQAKASRQGKKILEVEDVSFAYSNDPLIKDFRYFFQKKDRIGIVGPNGAGKTTLIRLLQGEMTPQSGQISVGATTKFGYYKQIEMDFDDNQTVIDFAKDIAEVVEVGKGKTISVSQFLNKFLFAPEVQYKPIGVLSGGEKRRLQLLQILIQSPNFLILDEPTNDLDLITLNVLEEYLEAFEGSVLIISHDRYFMDKLVDHLFVFEENGFIKDFPGNYTEYRNASAKTVSSLPLADPSPSKKAPVKELKEKKKLSYKEKREFEELEQRIPLLESTKKELLEALNLAGSDHTKLQEISLQIKAVEEELEEQEMRWLELSEHL